MKITDFKKISSAPTHKRKFGETYMVEHEITGEKGVLKLIQKEGLSETMLTRLRIESTVSFKEKGLPEILCCFENERYFSFIKRYQEGILWQKYVDLLSDKDFYRHLPKAVSQLLELLHIVHQKGFIHGDVKPSNILIHALSPDEFQLELIDFGLCFPIGKINHAKLSFPLGYAAPELILGHLDVANETTDFYSLGITIYNLITDTIPLAHINPEIFVNLQLTHPIPVSSKIPKSVFTLIVKMTAKAIFPLPPNRLSREKVQALLIEGIEQRESYEVLLQEWRSLEIKKRWLKYR